MKPIFFAIFLLLVSEMFFPSSTLAAPVVGKRGNRYIGNDPYGRGRGGGVHPPPNPVGIVPKRPYPYGRGGGVHPPPFGRNDPYGRGRGGGVHPPPNPVGIVPKRPYPYGRGGGVHPPPFGRNDPYGRGRGGPPFGNRGGPHPPPPVFAPIQPAPPTTPHSGCINLYQLYCSPPNN